MKRNMKVLYIVAEYKPFSKVGGDGSHQCGDAAVSFLSSST
jgi:hypothetical protein